MNDLAQEGWLVRHADREETRLYLNLERFIKIRHLYKYSDLFVRLFPLVDQTILVPELLPNVQRLVIVDIYDLL